MSTEYSGNEATGNASATASGAIGGRQSGEHATQQLAESHDTNDGQQEPRQNGQQNGAADGNAQNTEQPQDPPNSHRVAIVDGIVHLPAGTSLAAVQIAGDDIWLNQPDGSIIIITGGAADIPTFVIGDVQIPAETIAAALQNAPEVAPAAPGEGPAQAQGEGLAQPGSSGGDFSRPPGDIGAPFDLTALLPPTALLFPEPTVQELFQPLAVEENIAGGTASVTAVADEAYEDGSSTTAGQATNDAANTLLTLSFTLLVTPTDAADVVDSATIGGIPAGATASVLLTNANTLVIANGTVTRGDSADVDQFLDDLIGGRTLAVTLAEHDSADVTITLSAVVDGTATDPADATTVVDTVAADPVLTDPPDQQVNEGGASTIFTVTVEADFADLGDNEFAQILFADLPAGWTITEVTGNSAAPAGGTGTTALPGGLTDAYSSGYTAYNVTPNPDGTVTLTVEVTAPGDVATNTTEALGIVARAYDLPTDTEVAPELLGNNVATDEQSVDLTIVDVPAGTGGTASVTVGADTAYEDASSTTAGQATNDAANTLLTLSFTLLVTPTDAADVVDSATIGGIPAGATASWTDGVNTLDFGPGSTAVTPTSGGTGTNAARAAFLLALEGGTTLEVTLAEHDSADVTITLSAVVDGTGTNTAQDTTIVDTVAADPVLTDPTDQEVNEGGASTTFTVTVEADFADLGDNEFAQILFAALPAGWTITSVTGNSAALAGGTGTTALPGDLTDAYSSGYTAYNVTPAGDGTVSLEVTISAPGDVATDTTETLGIVARAYDLPTDTEVAPELLANNVATDEQSVDLTIQANPVLWKIAQSDNSGTPDDGTVLEGGTATYAISFATEANSADLAFGETVTVRLTFGFGDTSPSDFDPEIANSTTGFWQEVFDDLAARVDLNATAVGNEVTVDILDNTSTKVGEATFNSSNGELKVVATDATIPRDLTLIEFDLTAAEDNGGGFGPGLVNTGNAVGWGVGNTQIDNGEALFVEFQTTQIDIFNFNMEGFTKPGSSEGTSFTVIGLDASGNPVAITSADQNSGGASSSITVDGDGRNFTATSNAGGDSIAGFSIEFAEPVTTVKIVGLARTPSLNSFDASDGSDTFVVPEPGSNQAPQSEVVVLTDAEDNPLIILRAGVAIPTTEPEPDENFTISLVDDVDPAGDVPDGLSSMSSVTTTIEDTGEASGADPLVLDLGAPGIDLSATALFDINADSQLDQIAWPGGQDGILVMDRDGSGAIENGAEMFSPYFAAGGFKDALDALSSLDLNGDGIIDAQDAAFADLRVWVDANQDGVSQDGELFGLTDLEIASIDLNAQPAGYQIDGQTVIAEGQYTLSSGESRPYVAVDLKQQDLAGSDLVATGGETIVGGDGDDVLLSLGGGNTLYGGPGADMFVLAGLDAADLIADYDFAEGDIVDLTALFTVDTSGAGSVDDLSDFVRVVHNGAGLDDDLQVGADGGADTWTTVATLNADVGVTILYDDDGADQTATLA